MDGAMRAPITITKHGKPRVIMVAYEDFPEFGQVSISELSKKTQSNIRESRKLPKSAFRDL